MATTTPNLGLTKPTVGADADAWGGQLNASLDTLDAKVLDKTTGGTVSGAVNVIAATTAPAVRITQTGTGEALRVEDEANPDATPFVIDAAGNVGVGTGTPNFLASGAASGISIRAISSNAAGINVSSSNINNTRMEMFSAFSLNQGGFYLKGDSEFPEMIFGQVSGPTFRDSMVLDPAGNLGLGVTPSAWRTTDRAFDIGTTGGLYCSASSDPTVAMNEFINTAGSRTYKTTGFASRYQQNFANGAHLFFTAPSGTAGAPINFRQDMTLTQGGNLLVGTTTDDPTQRFRVFGGDLAIEQSRKLVLNAAAGSNNYIDSEGSPGGMRFYTVNTERARITSAGYFKFSPTGTDLGITALVGGYAGGNYHAFFNNQPNDTLVVGTSSTSASAYCYTSCMNSGAAGFHHFALTNGSPVFRVAANGQISSTSTTITSISDQRMKENIRPLSDGLAAINALQPRMFDWKDGKGRNVKDDRGFIAQEFETVFPDMIEEWKDGDETYKALRADLIPILVKAVQELSAQNAALESRLAALEAK